MIKNYSIKNIFNKQKVVLISKPLWYKMHKILVL